MKDKLIASVCFLRIQTFTYSIVIAWAFLIYSYQDIFLITRYVESFIALLFFIYFFVVLFSVIILIIQLKQIFISEDETLLKKLWVVSNIILYYAVIMSDLYLSTQIRF
jgi:hypothetical protein